MAEVSRNGGEIASLTLGGSASEARAKTSLTEQIPSVIR
jgi:hypothetical protein